MYATVDDLITRYGEAEIVSLTDEYGQTGAIVPAKAEAAINDAVNLIHGYLAKRYAIPLDPCPHLVTVWTCTLARWFLHRQAPPEQVKANYERTLIELKLAAEGVIELMPKQPPESGGEAQLIGPQAMFKPPALNGF